MTTCPTCGAVRAQRCTRGPLTTQIGPPGVWWRGEPLALSPSQHAILHLLCQRGLADHFALGLVALGPDAKEHTIHVRLSQMRRRLPRELQIESIFGWGYRLVLPGDPPLRDVPDKRRVRIKEVRAGPDVPAPRMEDCDP